MKKRDFVKTLSKTPPKGCDLKVGDYVEWENDNGAKWKHKIIGFNYDGWYQKEYKCYAHLDKDSFWFPHNHLKLKKVEA